MEKASTQILTPTSPKKMYWWHCVVIFAVANVISFIPAGFNGNEAFYNAFVQPTIAPPDWLFAPMWLFLNITSLIGLYTIANLPLNTTKRRTILALEYCGWVLFAIFTFFYFYLESPILGAIDTVLGFIVAFFVVLKSYRISNKAFWNFLPRLLWLLLASYVSIWVALKNDDMLFQVGPFLK